MRTCNAGGMKFDDDYDLCLNCHANGINCDIDKMER